MSPSIELLPNLSWYPPDTPINVEVITRPDKRMPPRTELVVQHWGSEVARVHVDGPGVVELRPMPAGGYGVRLIDHEGTDLARTAIDVRAPGSLRMRYGFVSDYQPDRDVTGVDRLVRQLHLTAVQFYDWGYRHADLIGRTAVYDDPLGQQVSTDVVRELITTVQSVGADALGYAAVYAVGNGEWEQWAHDALLAADATPYALGDFLRIVDPAASDWLEHLCSDLTAASELGFDGFHLDQYGYPKTARRADGAIIDLVQSFVSLIAEVRRAIPHSTLVFNNVNNFGTEGTKHAQQDAIYIEPWAPSTTLNDLAKLATEARQDTQLPIVIAAYQSVYNRTDAKTADRSTSLTMATLLSHGATQLLAGEANRILVDPYYPRNHPVEPSTATLLHRWYDFAVEHDELLMDPSITDITASTAGDYNDDFVIDASTTTISFDGAPGTVWQRNTRVGSRTVISLINLVSQSDTAWDEPRKPHQTIGGLTLRIRAVQGCATRVRVADPDGTGHLVDANVDIVGTHAVAHLRPLQVWQLVCVDTIGEHA